MRKIGFLLACAALAGCGPGLATGFDSTNFDPSDVPGLRAWFRADSYAAADGTELTGTFPWMERTRSYLLTPESGPDHPYFFASSGPLGRPIVRLYDGSGPRRFRDGAFNFSTVGVSGITIFMVIQPIVGATTTPILGISNTAGFGAGSSYVTVAYDPGPGITARVGINAQTDISVGTGVPAAFRIVTVAWSGVAPGALELAVGGLAPVSSSGAYGIAQTLPLAGDFILGAAGGTIGTDMAETLVYQRSLSSTERGMVMQYLSNRYGL